MSVGSADRGCAQTCLHPVDGIRTSLPAKGVTSALTPKTFLKGLTPQFTLAIPAGALQFACYEWAKEQFAKAGQVGALAEVSCGAIGALGASVVRVPQEVLKQRIQADIYPNVITGFTTLMKTEGWTSVMDSHWFEVIRMLFNEEVVNMTANDDGMPNEVWF